MNNNIKTKMLKPFLNRRSVLACNSCFYTERYPQYEKMKQLSILLFALLSFSCSSQQKKCSEFWTGEFRYTDPSMVAYTIRRTDSLHIEKNLETNVEVHSSVKWKSECEYELTYLKITNVNRDVSDIIGKKIKVKITRTDGNFYETHAQSDAINTYLQFEKVNK